MHVTLSSAISLDGCLNDAGPERLILSSPEDLAAVDALRAESDAILVGARTLRADNPRLRVRSESLIRQRRESGRPEQPLRVTLTSTGDLSPDWHFWGADPQTPLVFCPEAVRERIDAIGLDAVIVPAGANQVDPQRFLEELGKRGIRRLLIEGGAAVNTLFLEAGLVNELRVSIAPVLVGQADAPRLIAPFAAANAARFSLRNVEQLGDCVVLHYACSSRRGSDEEWLQQAIDLSRRCPKSDTSFAVGAVIVSSAGQIIADGFSLEDGPGRHAEEVAIDKAVETAQVLAGTTLYSSLEPCSVRQSGKVPCTEHIIAAGISRVVFALHEPDLFVDCQGAERLREAGIEVTHVPALADQVRDVNSHLWD